MNILILSCPFSKLHFQLEMFRRRAKACQDVNYRDLDPGKVVDYDVSYDYCSVLHYGSGQGYCKVSPRYRVECTIKGQKVTDIGQRIGMSDKDIEEINKRYKCGNTGGGSKGKFIFN